MKEAQHYMVVGRVQGVGYRKYVQAVAQNLALEGWVRNLPDGAVEVYAAGDRAALARLYTALKKGPALGQVRSVHAQECAYAPIEGFLIRR